MDGGCSGNTSYQNYVHNNFTINQVIFELLHSLLLQSGTGRTDSGPQSGGTRVLSGSHGPGLRDLHLEVHHNQG